MSSKSTVPKAPKNSKAGKKPAPKKINTSVKSVMAPAAMTSVISSNRAIKPQPFHVVREEYLGDITGSAALSISSFPVNPGMPVFPWLSQIANAYDLYRFTRLRFWYRTRDTSADKGTVVLSFDPNPDDSTPSSNLQLENFDTRTVTTPWADAFFDVTRADLDRLKKFLVRNSLVASELATYDLGTLYTGVTGTGTGKVGELWVEYEVDFYAPQPFDAVNIVPQPTSNSVFRQIAPQTAAAAGSTTVLWDTAQTNPLGYVSNAGIFSGMRGAISVYAQVTGTIGAAPLTGGGINIQTSIDGGASFQNNILAYFPQSAANTNATANVFTVLQLLATHQFRVLVTPIGGTLTLGGSPNTILIITPA